MDRAEAEKIYEQGKEPVVMTILALDAERAALKEKIAELTKNSTNSNQPPSKDGPAVPRYPKKPASQKKQGAQPGHTGKNRKPLPLDEVNHIQHHFPERCQNCRRLLTDEEKRPAEKPLDRHQIWISLLLNRQSPNIKPMAAAVLSAATSPRPPSQNKSPSPISAPEPMPA